MLWPAALAIQDPAYTTVDQAREALAAMLARRRLLIVLDNVWTRAPLDAELGWRPAARCCSPPAAAIWP
ncbi:hypothetical protein [Actinomadura sp. 9N407]|uniref:hypothetical protein n=1 Tax=Actinomadura sp. 9N407 TaxID=3375154 RepID=UPI0037A7957C